MTSVSSLHRDDDAGLSLERVAGAVVRRGRLFLATFAIAGAVTVAAALAIPPSYKASVIMTIEPGRYPNDFLKPTVIPGLDTRIGGLEKLFASAPIIEELRARTGLAKEQAGSALDAVGFGNDAIDAWRKAFKFEILPGSQTGHRVEEQLVVEMSFKDSNAETAARVVNACAARANEENNRFRRAFVDEVVRFVGKNEERSREQLSKAQEAWNAFKLQNGDRLPEQEPHIGQRLSQLRIRYADLKNQERFGQARLEQFIAERNLLVTQIALVCQIAKAQGGNDQSTPADLRHERLELARELRSWEAELDRLHHDFSDKLPQVKYAEERVKKLKAAVKEIDDRLNVLGIVPPSTAPITSDLRPLGLLDDEGTKPDRPGELRKTPLVPRGPGASKLDVDKNDPVKAAEKGDAKDKGKTPPVAPVEKDPRADAAKKALEEAAKDSSPRKIDAEKAAEAAQAVIATSKVAEVLSQDPLDEKKLERALDELSYRIVVSNTSYARIKAIDFAVRETREAMKEIIRLREEAFAEMTKLEQVLAAMPEVRQRLEVLARTLIDAREDHGKIASQLDNAKKALDVENQGKGEQFRVIDFARPPSRPSGPGRPLFLGLALAAALGFAGVTCIVAEKAWRAPVEPATDATESGAPPPPPPRPATRAIAAPSEHPDVGAEITGKVDKGSLDDIFKRAKKLKDES